MAVELGWEPERREKRTPSYHRPCSFFPLPWKSPPSYQNNAIALPCLSSFSQNPEKIHPEKDPKIQKTHKIINNHTKSIKQARILSKKQTDRIHFRQLATKTSKFEKLTLNIWEVGRCLNNKIERYTSINGSNFPYELM